jgi:hypothetical protein
MTDGRQPDSPSSDLPTPSTINTPLSTRFWSALETVPGGTAPYIIWKHHLESDGQSGSDLETFTSLFLRAKPGEPAQFVPCPWKCGCYHKVVPRDNGTLAGFCQCAWSNCGEYTVLPCERVTWELDWPKISQVLCRAFGLQPKIVKLGLYNTLQIGAWQAHRSASDEGCVPAVLTLATNPVEFLNIVAVLVARFARPFILFAPTAKSVGLAAEELLSNLGSSFFPLDSHLALAPAPAPSPRGEGRGEGELSGQGPTDSLQLSTLDPRPSTLFKDLAPLLPDPTDEELARRVFMLLQQPDESTRRQPPTLYTVFHYYCVKELTIPQIARKCRCSIGTVANRLKSLQDKTGFPPEQLRRIAPTFTKFESDYRQATRNYRSRSRY